jgi:16S rRNA (guanine(966)-N(2))-methyltransferase RsmD
MQGAIGLEALSRGCVEAHFVEMDSWVVGQCLSRNIAAAGFEAETLIHKCKVEDFLLRANASSSLAARPFDFISVTPPYMQVSYPQLFDLLSESPLLHDRSVLVVEYSKQNASDIPSELGPLTMAKDRVYGRTRLAVYANV